LKQWARDRDPLLADLARRFINRNLFKAVDLELPADARERFWDKAREAIARAGFDPQYYLITDRAADIPYYGYYSPVGIGPENLIYIETGGPRSSIREISEVSEVVRGMRGYRIDRVCFPVEVADEIASIIAECAIDAEARSAG
jgi:hypothetical protein